MKKIELNGDLIKKKGIYEFGDESYFLLYPNYLDEVERKDLSEYTTTIKFNKQKSRDTHYVGPAYAYSSVSHPDNHSWSSCLIRAKAKLELNLLSPLNSVLINRYGENQSIPFHKDDEPCLGENPTIASLSIGETGKMIVKSTYDNTKFLEILLYPGSLLVMFGNFNKHYVHAVERSTTSNKYRINFTFRYIHTGILSSNSTPVIKPASNSSLSSQKNVEKLQEELNVMKSEILAQRYQQHKKSEEESNNKVVILKYPETVVPTTESMLNSLNMHIPSDEKLKIDDILEVKDYRENNGPITVEFAALSTKVSILKNVKDNDSIVVKDCLSKEMIKLRKYALKLLKEKKIGKVWSYRGDVYFTFPRSKTRIFACWDNLRCLSGYVLGSAAGK